MSLALGLQRHPPRAFNNQPAGVKHCPGLRPLHPRLPPGTGLRGICWTATFCLPPVLDLSSPSRHHQPAPELLSLPACCCACEQTQLRYSYSPDAGIVRPSCNCCSLYSTTRSFPGTSSTVLFHSLTDRGPSSITHSSTRSPPYTHIHT